VPFPSTRPLPSTLKRRVSGSISPPGSVFDDRGTKKCLTRSPIPSGRPALGPPSRHAC
jgi:hypothetical protein